MNPAWSFLRQAARAVLEPLRLWRPVVAVRRRWRRSLQARVLAATVALSTIVMLVLGSFIYERISDGLIQDRERAAEIEHGRLVQEARRKFVSSTSTNLDSAGATMYDVVAQLQGPTDNHDKAVLMLKALSSTEPGRAFNPSGVNYVAPGDIPMDLRQKVNALAGRQQRRLWPLPRPPDGASSGPSILVGSVINTGRAGPYELYVGFRLDREQEMLGVIRKALLAGGLVLALCIAGVAYLVTRQVVTPVRLAASTAEQLASGRLDRRIRVRGEDDLARLGRAFNKMAASLERQITALEELSRVQRRFVSDVSHELRTPLTTIRMAGELLYEARSSFDPAISRSVELLQAQLDRFEALLADLLEISRFDAGAAQLELEQGDLCDVVLRVVDGLRPLAERRGSQVRVTSSDVACTAEIDSRRVERIVRNLLANAIEHGEGRPIEVVVGADESAAAVVIRDHGVGLTPAEVRMVFNRFWRGDPARARTTGGTGLGLAIALEDAHLHGGRLEAWGVSGEGASFRLTVPRRGGEPLVSEPLPLVPADARPPVPAGEHAPEEPRRLAPPPRRPTVAVPPVSGTSVVRAETAPSTPVVRAAPLPATPVVRAAPLPDTPPSRVVGEAGAPPSAAEPVPSAEESDG